MDVSAAEVSLGLVVLMCAIGAVYGARWISQRSDEQMERTRAALRARHAEPERRPAPSPQVVVPQPAREAESATRLLPRADSRVESAAVPASRVEPATRLPRAEPAGLRAEPAGSRVEPAGSRVESAETRSGGGTVVSTSSGKAAADLPPTSDEDVDPDSSGRHRVPEELMRAATYSLSPDRVARAKVPGPRPRREQDRLTDRRP